MREKLIWLSRRCLYVCVTIYICVSVCVCIINMYVCGCDMLNQIMAYHITNFESLMCCAGVAPMREIQYCLLLGALQQN